MATCQPGTSYTFDLSNPIGGGYATVVAGYPQGGGGRKRSVRRKKARSRKRLRRNDRKRSVRRSVNRRVKKSNRRKSARRVKRRKQRRSRRATMMDRQLGVMMSKRKKRVMNRRRMTR